VLERAGLAPRRVGGGGFVVDAEPEQVGGVALRERVALRELRLADRSGLEDLFISLTREPANGGARAATTTTKEPDLMEVTR
jgi:ABC-2 type transport system ATP-binding protein